MSLPRQVYYESYIIDVRFQSGAETAVGSWTGVKQVIKELIFASTGPADTRLPELLILLRPDLALQPRDRREG